MYYLAIFERQTERVVVTLYIYWYSKEETDPKKKLTLRETIEFEFTTQEKVHKGMIKKTFNYMYGKYEIFASAVL